MALAPYAKPSSIGGTLIRKVIAQFKSQGFPLPISGPVFIAVSGGVDSMVLAHLLATYGRKVVVRDQITLLHFDHQWRKESGTTEKVGVKQLAKDLGIEFRSIRLDRPSSSQAGSKNLEEDARLKRVHFFEQLSGPGLPFAYGMTAHHLNDVAETLFWRFLRGEFLEQNEGIKFQDHHVLRPFLKVSKEEIDQYAKAEKVNFFEDPTNQNENQMRAFLRGQVFPLIQTRFPGFQASISKYANDQGYADSKKTRAPSSAIQSNSLQLISAIEALAKEKLNRYQRAEIASWMTSFDQKSKVTRLKKLSLPGGHVLERRAGGVFIRILKDADD